MGAVQFAEFGEDQSHTGLDLLIRVERHGPGAVMDQTGRDRQAQFAASRLLPFALMQAQSDLVQFRFTHDAGQAEQQAIMIRTRIEQTLAIGKKNPEQRAQFQQLMPVAVVARQP